MPDDALWLAAPTSTYALSQYTVLTLNRDTCEVIELAPLTAGILGLCRGAKPLRAHTASARQPAFSSSLSALEGAMDSLVSLGLLRAMPGDAPPSASSLLASASIPTVVIITCDREEALARALAAWGVQERYLGRTLPTADSVGVRADDAFDGRTEAIPAPRTISHPQLIVVDGSAHKAGITRATVDSARKRMSQLYYAGVDAARQLRGTLDASGAPPHVIDAALTLGGIGSNRNIGILLTAGSPIVMQDDDVIADPWMGQAEPVGPVTLAGHADLREWCFFPSRAQALESARRVDVDLRSMHGEVLGRSLADLLAGRMHAVDFEPTCAHMATAVVQADKRKVRVTFCGLAGDSARYCSHGIVFRPGPLRDQLWTDESAFRTATTSREVTVIARGLLVTHDVSCLGYCMGIDNTSLVPPFIPFGRNEDGVWGATLSFMDPTALFAHLPVGVRHASDRLAVYEQLMSSARQSRISDVLLFLVGRAAQATFALTPADRLRHLGALLVQVGTLPVSEFQLLLTEARLATLTAEIAHAKAATSDPLCPYWWRDAITTYESTFRKSLSRADFFLPIEFKETVSIDQGFSAAQTFVRTYGEILTWWPTMWEKACAQLHGSDNRRDLGQ